MRSLTFDDVFGMLSAVPLSASDLARLREWLPYLRCVLESRTVRDAARIVGVYRTTSFRWRHRFVPGAMRDRPARLTAIVEADETFLYGRLHFARHFQRCSDEESRSSISGLLCS